MIISGVLIIAICLITLNQTRDFIDFYISDYESRLQEFNGFEFNIDCIDNHLYISKVSIILQNYYLFRSFQSFQFSNALYLFSFNLLIINSHKLTIKRNNLLIEHTFNSILFTQQLDNTFQVEFKDNPDDCSFFTKDLFSYSIFDSIDKAKKTLCKTFNSLLIKKIITFSNHYPRNEDEYNFEDLMYQLIVDDNSRDNRTHICDYQLNDNNRVVNIRFDNINYAIREKDAQRSVFRFVKVNIYFSVLNKELGITQEKETIIFNNIEFGKDFILFFSQSIQKHYLWNFIANIISQFEKQRKWISEY